MAKPHSRLNKSQGGTETSICNSLCTVVPQCLRTTSIEYHPEFFALEIIQSRIYSPKPQLSLPMCHRAWAVDQKAWLQVGVSSDDIVVRDQSPNLPAQLFSDQQSGLNRDVGSLLLYDQFENRVRGYTCDSTLKEENYSQTLVLAFFLLSRLSFLIYRIKSVDQNR